MDELAETNALDAHKNRQAKALKALLQHAQAAGPIKSIKDPVVWQRQQRESTDPWQEIAR